MLRLLILLITIIAISACGQGTVSAQDSTAYDKEAIGEIIREYILENPEIIEDALIVLQQRARDEAREAQRQSIKTASDRLYNDERDPYAGPKDARVQIVEFFDYRCSFCTLTSRWVGDVLEQHPDDVKVIFKEFPIRGDESETAARASLAIWKTSPEDYLDIHMDLIRTNGPLPKSRIDTLISEAGINLDSVNSQMTENATLKHLSDVLGLARDLGITGTPFFIINGEIIAGADMNALNAALETALEQTG